jgi:hypothetical protein
LLVLDHQLAQVVLARQGGVVASFLGFHLYASS